MAGSVKGAGLKGGIVPREQAGFSTILLKVLDVSLSFSYSTTGAME
jgi:hypothetical protein